MAKVLMVPNVQDRIDVAHWLDLQFQEIVDITDTQWRDLKSYTRLNGLKIKP